MYGLETVVQSDPDDVVRRDGARPETAIHVSVKSRGSDDSVVVVTLVCASPIRFRPSTQDDPRVYVENTLRIAGKTSFLDSYRRRNAEETDPVSMVHDEAQAVPGTFNVDVNVELRSRQTSHSRKVTASIFSEEIAFRLG